jgi:tetratricopeptide (TPR) repeat protein
MMRAWVAAACMLASLSACSDPGAIDPCNERYDRGEYDTAAECYQASIQRGLTNATVYFNLGNAELRRGRIGAAIAAYRAAQLLRPMDPDVAVNLAAARELTVDDLPAFEAAAGRKWLLFWADRAGVGALLTATLLGWVLLFALLAVQVHRPGLPRSLPGAVGLVTLLLALGAGYRAWEHQLRPTAVVAAEELDAMSGRDRLAVKLFQLHEGAELRVLEQRDGWLRVELSNGWQAWVKKSDLHIVNLW